MRQIKKDNKILLVDNFTYTARRNPQVDPDEIAPAGIRLDLIYCAIFPFDQLSGFRFTRRQKRPLTILKQFCL
jgi:hypothetical protein